MSLLQIRRQSCCLFTCVKKGSFSQTDIKTCYRIGIWGPNTHQWYLTQFAAAKAGLVLVNINPAYRTTELEYCLNKVGVKCLVAADKFKTQNYYKMLSTIFPYMETIGPGTLSSLVPSLQSIIMMSESNHSGTFRLKQ